MGRWKRHYHFYSIPLKRVKDGGPPLIFGCMATCYPSNGYLESIEELKLYNPHRNCPPDLIHLQGDEISKYSRKPVKINFFRVQF